MTGFFKKLKDTAEKGLEKSTELGTKGFDAAKDSAKKGLEKSTELGTKGFDAAKDSAKKGIEKAREEKNPEEVNPEPIQVEEIPKNEINSPDPSAEINDKQTTSQSSDKALKLLKLRFAKGEISKEDYEEMKSVLE